MLSVVIPSHNDIYLNKTIQSLLDNARGEIEVIVVLDGYWAEVVDDPRVRVLHLGKNQGMRNAINSGVRLARGEYIMRTDEHCLFAPGYDVELTKTCEPNWIMTMTRYFLDPVKWEVMDLEPVEYEKLVVQSVGKGRKFTGYPFPTPSKEPIIETQAMQGSCWFMPKKWWEDVIVELQTEGYGPHLQDSHEMVFKTWKAGGKLMVNRNTWFAHKHVSFDRTHSYPRDKAEKEMQYCFDTWSDYYQELKKEWRKSQS